MANPTVRSYLTPVSEVYNSSAGTISTTWQMPATVNAGDLLLMIDWGISWNTGYSATPYGTPSINGVALSGGAGYFGAHPNGHLAVVYTYRITGTEASATFVSEWSQALNAQGVVVILENASATFDAVNTIRGGSVNDGLLSSTATSFASPTLTTTQANELILEWWADAEEGSGSAYPGPMLPTWSTLPNATASPSQQQLQTIAGNNCSVVAMTSLLQVAAGAVTVSTAKGTDSTNPTGAGSTAAIRIGVTLPAAPLAPTLNTPTNAAYEDLSVTEPFTWTHNASDGGSTQGAYALRVKATGASSYQYWNAGTSSLQSSIVWNTSTNQSMTMPAGLLSNGTTYNWSVATQDAFSGFQGPFASDDTITGQVPPMVTVTAPTGTVMTFTPAVSWATTFPSGATQQDYRAVMYSAAQYSAPGFVAGISPSTWDTGVVASSGTSVAPPSSVLANNTTYRAYVQVTESGSENSTWSYATFTLAVDTPATPAVTVTAGTDPVTGAPTVTVVLQGSDNLLSANDGSFETGVGTWTCGSATLASDTTHPEDGTHDLKITATAAASLAPTTGFYAVQPSTQYSAGADFLAGSTGRTVGLSIGWYTSADALISTSVGTATTDSSAGYVRATVTATSPSNAAYAKVVASITSVANTEVHYLEDVCLRPGASATFTTGGAAGSVTDELQYSDDGVTWADVRGGGALTVPASQQISVIDYEMIPGTARQYRAQGSYLVTGNVVVSPWSTPVTATVTTTTWWAVVPGTPTLNTSMDVQTQTTQVLERSASHYGLGDTYPTVLADVVGSIDGTITVQSQSAAAYNALLALVQAQTVIWLTSPVSGGSSVTALYVRLGIPSGSSSGSTAGNTAHASSLEVSPGSTPLRNTTYSYVAMPKP